ncbi:TMAO reductase system periplasmic protein TorT [Vibrio sp. JPW-9-11-11]|uniref:TMAO reductase system periplasmic protein TorT n=1 Tax=Vibrio sp. JPW-9-11-11 TaxID=1416532 RepID=UPI001594CA5E|nr:TMAO reductase system periplasmic protein TorT [Vibrio sp. JPW-9-11-11]NVD07866.1 TMAO reductase system periplasmic protein TorT [Vibrio sp. JPW-9-11-11]
MPLIFTLKNPAWLAIAAIFAISITPRAVGQQVERLCAVYPHLKDSYWLSVNYGMVDEARVQGVDLRVLEAGGYPNLDKQREQLELCTEWQADAIILGTVAPDLYAQSLKYEVNQTPVFATVNKLITDQENQSVVKGEVGVDWYWMGYYAGEYLKKKHPKGSGIVEIALLPGPKSSGGTKPVIQGFYSAIQNSDIEIKETYWADNDKELQRNLVQQVIEQSDVQYIVGSAVAIEAAVSELRSSGKQQQIGLISTYLSHGVYRGLLRNRIEFAPSDKMVLQGRLSVKQAVRYLRNQPYEHVQAPIIEPLTPTQLSPEVIANSLSPSEYRPTFYIYNENN